MRVLLVKLSSLGDVVHTMPVVHDIATAFPAARIDWVVEPAFAPLLRRIQGIAEVIECPLRRWRRRWWSSAVRNEWRAFRERLQRERYDAVIDLQGLTKSALVARLARVAPGRRHGLGNATEGSGFEWPARWLVDNAIRIEPRIHALDRARVLTAKALGYSHQGRPEFGLRTVALPVKQQRPSVAFVHGTSRDDKLWPIENWVKLGERFTDGGWRIVLPQGNAAEQTRADLIAAGLQRVGNAQVEVWPSMPIDAALDHLAATQGVVGVDSGLSHMAVALKLPHVQLYNHATAWRTGPLPEHGMRHQIAIEGRPTPELETVWAAWNRVLEAARA
jgi:heptosyltransferase-1